MRNQFRLGWAPVFVAVAAIAGCGGRQLESLSITPVNATAQNGQAQFTVTGQFNSMPTTAPTAVAWVQMPPGFDPAGDSIGFTLTTQPFTAQCGGGTVPTVVRVMAYAPSQPGAMSGSIPLSVFEDLIIFQRTSQEAGFVAASAQLTCP